MPFREKSSEVKINIFWNFGEWAQAVCTIYLKCKLAQFDQSGSYTKLLRRSWKFHQLYVFCHPQFSSVIQNIENCCAIRAKFWKFDFWLYKIDYFENKSTWTNRSHNGTTIFNILDNTTELWMTKYIIGEIFSSGRATLYKNPSDQTVFLELWKK